MPQDYRLHCRNRRKPSCPPLPLVAAPSHGKLLQQTILCPSEDAEARPRWIYPFLQATLVVAVPLSPRVHSPNLSQGRDAGDVCPCFRVLRQSCFRYLVAVTSDLDKVSYTLERLLPLISPRDSLVLIHIVDECVEDVLAGDMVDVEQVGRRRSRHYRRHLHSCYRRP